jgi:hypothetical protein
VTTTDARGQVTNYEYDPTHGGITKATLPVGPNGVRPETRYGYTLLGSGLYALTSVILLPHGQLLARMAAMRCARPSAIMATRCL